MEPYIALSYIDTYHPEMLAALTNGFVDFEMLRHDAAEVQSREGLRTSNWKKTTSTSKTRISNVVTWRVDMLFDMIIHDIRFCHIWCDFWCYMYSIVFACIRILQSDIWSLEFQNQVLSLLRNLPSWQFPRCGPVWKGVNHFVVSKVFTNECALMSNLLWWSITLLVQHIQWNQFLCAVHRNSWNFEKNIAKLFHWWRSTVVTKYKASPTLRSCVLHFCLPHLHREPQSFDHVINVDAWSDPQITSWQPTFKQDERGWIHPRTIRDTACLMNLWWTSGAGNSVQSQASGQRKHQIAGLFDAACPLQIAGTCYVHLPLQGQTRTSSLEIMISVAGNSIVSSFRNEMQRWQRSVPIVSLLFSTFFDEQRDDSLKIA